MKTQEEIQKRLHELEKNENPTPAEYKEYIELEDALCDMLDDDFENRM